MSAPPLVRTLTVVTAATAVSELIPSGIIWREAYPDSEPLFAVALAGVVVAAAVLAGRFLSARTQVGAR